jgi:hypothetical protein
MLLMQRWSDQPEERGCSICKSASNEPSTGIAHGIQVLIILLLSASTCVGPCGLPHSKKAGKKLTKEGGRTTRVMICTKIKSQFKEVFWGSLRVHLYNHCFVIAYRNKRFSKPKDFYHLIRELFCVHPRNLNSGNTPSAGHRLVLRAACY